MAYRNDTLATCLPLGENRRSCSHTAQLVSTVKCRLAVMHISMHRFMHKYQAYEYVYILESVSLLPLHIDKHFAHGGIATS